MTATPQPTNTPVWRIILAFVVVPGAAALLMAILMPAYDGISEPLEKVWRTAILLAVFGAYPITVIFGVPAFFILRRHFKPTLFNCSLTGAGVAALPWFIVSALIHPGSASIGGRDTVIDGTLTPYGWITNLTFVGEIAAFGAVGGALFWLVAAAGSQSGKNR